MVRNRNNGFNLEKTLKDYAVPLIGLFIVFIILVISFWPAGKDDNINNNENQVGIETSLVGADDEAYIVYSGGEKKKIDGNISLFKGEKVKVVSGDVLINFPNLGKITLGKLGELKYSDDGTLSLLSSNLFLVTPISSLNKSEINMKFASIKASSDTVLSLSQNEVQSTIYLLKGVVEVSNNAGKSTILTPGKKIVISMTDSNKEDLDLELKKQDIDDIFKKSDWYIKNKGDFYLSEKTATGTGDTVEPSNIKEVEGELISLDFIKDEISVPSAKIDIDGKVLNEVVAEISVNGEKAIINNETKTFSIKGFTLKNKTNDLVFKIYNEQKDLIGKYVYTVYYNGATDIGTSSSSGGNGSVENFKVDASKFEFTAPNTTGKYITYDTQNTIKGKIAPGIVDSVVVNGLKLSSFNGTTWRYHAWESFGNLEEGTNVYEIKYLGKDGNLIYTDRYTIIKKVKGTGIISDEASVQ